jgi:hypothetical protein
MLAITDRAARRVYFALAWVHARAEHAPIELKQRLRKRARWLSLTTDEARRIEAEARGARSVRLGRDDIERALLREALADLGSVDASAAKVADGLLRHLAPAMARRCPFEESETGPPLIRSARLVPVA